MESNLYVSDVFKKIYTAYQSGNYKIIINEGSSRSSKTYSSLQFLILLCIEKPKLKVTISRLKLTWLRKTVFEDFKTIMQTSFSWFWQRGTFNKTEMVFTFNNGSTITFIGSEESQKLHGLKQDVYYGNEYDEASVKQFQQAIIRTSELFLIDYNPKYTEHWIYSDVETRKDAILLKSTYKDNPFLEQSVVNEIELLQHTDPIAWRVYGLGERAMYKGLIYQNWRLCDTMPDVYEWRVLGQDSGYNDPYTLIDVRFADGQIYVNELIYKSYLTHPQILQQMQSVGISENDTIIADSADISLINFQRQNQYNVRGVKKFAGFVFSRIQTLQRYIVNVTKNSSNIIREKNGRRWKEHAATGKLLDEPEASSDHALDAIEYVVFTMRHNSNISE